MVDHPLPAALCRALARHSAFTGLTIDALEPMPAKGLAHDHIDLKGWSAVARVPRWSQLGLAPAENLAQQAAGFMRAAASGHTPPLTAVLEPSGDLPMGALVVGRIDGRPPHLPDDMPAIAQALAALHRLPLPSPASRAPLASPADPVAATLALLERQAVHFQHAGLAADAMRQLETELDMVRRLPAGPPPAALIGTDTHPGNFLIDARGKAWFVDLEKAQYGLPGIDLAHASLHTSTTWDPDCAAVLAAEDVAAFYRTWEAAVPPGLADAMRPWRQPLRRLVWLRSLSWMARWRVEGCILGAGVLPHVQQHVRARIDDFFQPETIAGIRAELTAG